MGRIVNLIVENRGSCCLQGLIVNYTGRDLHPGSFRLFEITFSTIIYELVATITNIKTLLTLGEGGANAVAPPLPCPK